MAETKRRKGESFEALLRRFNDRVKRSGTILQTKKIRFHKRDLNRNKMRAAAKRRSEITAKRDYLRKIGRLTDERF